MTPLQGLEKLLGITFSSHFIDFWTEYDPANPSSNTPNFEVRKSNLGGPFGCRLPRPNHPNGWLIKIERDLPYEAQEVTLAHEIIHSSLDVDGYPMIGRKEGAPSNSDYARVAANLHSVLVHPIIWLRMREFDFPVDSHILMKSSGQLSDLRKIHRYPSRSKSPEWEDWVLRYMLARLEWGEAERAQIYDIFAARHSAIGRQGEKYLRKLDSLGYSEPQLLNPDVVRSAGEMLISRLKLDNVFSLPSI